MILAALGRNLNAAADPILVAFASGLCKPEVDKTIPDAQQLS
jgi:hypothetical protein